MRGIAWFQIGIFGAILLRRWRGQCHAPQQSNEDGGGWWRAGRWTEEVEEAERPKHSKKGECFLV